MPAKGATDAVPPVDDSVSPMTSDRVTAIVVCGPVPPSPEAVALIPRRPDCVVAADVGLRHAAALGVKVDLVVGDLDSLDAAEIDAARRAGITIERHSRFKDVTDLELAILAAIERDASRVVVVDGGVGPRVDHFLANALVLASARFAACRVEAALGDAWVSVINDRSGLVALRGAVGSIVTLLAVGGAARGVTSDGLRWALDRRTLRPGSSLGVSNEIATVPARIEVESGCLLAIQPFGGAQ
jgi:thiamine pyrophosphokinase